MKNLQVALTFYNLLSAKNLKQRLNVYLRYCVKMINIHAYKNTLCSMNSNRNSLKCQNQRHNFNNNYHEPCFSYTTVEDSCKWCCRTDYNSSCSPYIDASGRFTNLDDGMPCVQGYCNQVWLIITVFYVKLAPS